MKEPVFKEEAKKRAKTEEEAPARAEPQAPVAVAPMPSSAPYISSPKKKGSLGLQLGPSAPSGAEDDSTAVQASDSLKVDRDSKFAESQRSELATQSLESARVASNRGDRLSEIRLLAQVLQNGATGYQRVEALKRICDAYEALGEPDRADPFCDQLISEFPATAAAKAVSDRRKQVQRAPAPAPSKNSMQQDRERKAVSDESKAVDQAPASSY
jgi:hypothetical protein